MASHKLNASSSRSHCLLTLYIDSSPLASASEVISSRLTLVDLAGSERGATVGATEGEMWGGRGASERGASVGATEGEMEGTGGGEGIRYNRRQP